MAAITSSRRSIAASWRSIPMRSSSGMVASAARRTGSLRFIALASPGPAAARALLSAPGRARLSPRRSSPSSPTREDRHTPRRARSQPHAARSPRGPAPPPRRIARAPTAGGAPAARPRLTRTQRTVRGHQEARKFEPAGRAPWSGGRPRGPTRGLGDAASIALALDGEDLGVMDDAIDERGGRGGVGEDRRPLAERQVGGEHEALAFVAAADDLKEEGGGPRVVGQVADLVDDEEGALGVVGPPGGQGPRPLLTAAGQGELGRAGG